jgi:hypothetical protein
MENLVKFSSKKTYLKNIQIIVNVGKLLSINEALFSVLEMN